MKKSVLIAIVIVSLLIGFVFGMGVGLNQSNGTTTTNSGTTTTTSTTKKITTTKKTTTTKKVTTTTKKPATIIMPSLPKECSLGTAVKIKITKVTYSINSSGDVYLYFTGEKTYDKRGNNSNSIGALNYKIYDSNGYVVASGRFLTGYMSVGDKFQNKSEFVSGMYAVPGKTYRLELYDCQ